MTTRWPCMLLVTLCLLAFGTSASAECAWLLWREEQENFPGSPSKKTWITPLAYPDRAACVATIVEKVKVWEQRGSPQQEVTSASNGTAAEFVTWTRDRMGFMLSRVHCLPDTVDPRGSKGK